MQSFKNEPDETFATRWSLIRRLTKPDCGEAAWSDFYGLYRNLIYFVGRKAGLTHEEAEDAVSETMSGVCARIAEFTPEPGKGSFRAWLMTMARRRIADQFRQRVRHAGASVPEHDSNGGALPGLADTGAWSMEKIWEETWREELFRRAVDQVKRKVSPRQFQIFDFYALQRMPLAEICKSLGVSAAQVYLARHRVVRLVKQEIGAMEKSAH